MPHLLVRRPAAAATALAFIAGTLGLAGCSGSATVESTRTAAPASPGASTSAPTIATPPATLAGTAPSATQPPVSGTAVKGDDVANAVRAAVESAKTVHLAMKTPGGSATADLDLGRRAVKVVTGDGDAQVTLVHVNGSTWVKGAGTVEQPAPAGSPAAPATTTRHWLLLRPDGTDALSRKLGQAVNVEAMVHPAAFADMLGGLTGDRSTKDAGSHTEFWVPADKYVSVTKADAALAATLVQPVVVDLDLDGQNRPTRLVATLKTKDSSFTDDTTYSGWGQPVDIAPPPADDVAVAPQPADGTPAPGDAQTSTPAR